MREMSYQEVRCEEEFPEYGDEMNGPHALHVRIRALPTCINAALSLAAHLAFFPNDMRDSQPR